MSADNLHLLARRMSEKELSQTVFDAARNMGWLVARYPTWRPTHTTPGFPDLTLVRGARLIFAELKRERPRPARTAREIAAALRQKEWQDALRLAAVEVYVWKPSDWLSGRIEELLR